MTSRKGKYMRIFAVIAVLALAVCLTALVACVDPADPDPGTGTTYKIIFDAGENMQDPEDIVLSGSSQIILPELTRPGYSFDGWYVDEDFEVSLRDYLLGNQVSHNITAYAKWTAIEYDLTASVNNPKAGSISVDGEEYEDYSAKFVYGDKFTFTAISDPETAKYYTFVGWYDDSGRQVQGGTTYEFTAGADDTDLEARWRGAQLKIFFHNDRATDAAEEVVAVTDYRYGDTFTYVPDYAADSIFVGWSYIQTGGESASDGDGKFELFQPADEYLVQSNEQGIRYELHLYAEWQNADSELELIAVDGGYAVNGWKEAEYDGGTPPESFRIPSSFMGTPIVAVAENAFDNYFGSVFVPGSVTDIGANAFADTEKVYFDADADYGILAADLIDSGAENAYFNLLVWLNAKADYADFDYPMYIENGDGIFDTDIDSEEEFIAVYSYCWLYNVGSMDLDRSGDSGGTKVTFNLENAGIAADKIIETVLGLNSKNVKVRSGWIDKAISMIGLKSNTATQYGYIYDPENGEYELTIMFKDMSEDMSENGGYSYVASRETDEFMQTQAGAVFAEAAGEANPVLLPIDSLPEYVVYNSEQLVYAVENGFKPRFGTLSATAPDHAKKALQSARDVWDTARRILYSINSAGDSDFEKLLNIHDYIALNVIYDSALLQLSEEPQNSYSYLSGFRGFNLEGALLDGKAVCDGITKAFMLLARMEGIECIRVTGKNAENVGHAWNKVKIENTWYNIDVTGDDILTSGISGASCDVEVLTHDKFLVSDDYLYLKGYREDDYGYVKASGNYDFYDFVTPEALQGIENSDGDLSVSDKAEMNAVLLAAIAEAKKIFVDDPDADYVTFDIYWDSYSMLTSTVDLNYQYIPLSGQTEYSSKGAYAIVISKENVSEFEF